jgi:hypothetical protein
MNEVKTKHLNNSYRTLRTYAENENLIYPNLVKNSWSFQKILCYESKHTYLVAFIIITLFIFVTLVSGMIEKVFLNETLDIDMFHDIGFWMIIIVDYILTFLSIMIFRNFSKLFIQLHHNDMIHTDKTIFNKFFDGMNKNINRKIYIYFCYIVGFGIFLFQYRSMPLTTLNTWHIPNLTGEVSITSLVFIPLNLWHQVLIIQFLMRSFFISITMILFFVNNNMQIDFSDNQNSNTSAIEIIGKYAFINLILIFFLSLFLAVSLFSNTQIYGFSMYNIYNIILISEFIVCSFISIFSPIFLLI